MDGGTGAVNECPRSAPAEGMSERGSGAGTARHERLLTSSLELGPLPTAVPCARLRLSPAFWFRVLVVCAACRSKAGVPARGSVPAGESWLATGGTGHAGTG